MGKASDMGRAWADRVRAWASTLKLKQWLRWIGGDSPLPDVRSRKVVASTAGIGLVLVALAWFTLGGGGGNPTNGAKHKSPAPRYSPVASPLNAAQHGFLVPPAKTSTTTSSPNSASGTSKRGHSHTRHPSAKRPRTQRLG